MLNYISRAGLVGAWCAGVVVIGACSVVAGAVITISNGAWMLVAGLVPLAAMLVVWRDTPRIAVAELLDLVYKPSNEDRPKSTRRCQT
jgi:hypothetical protein